ncbi:MAG TPA: tripartite tricarboxylate transporter TctB family protein [Geminicoccaceae bacterium]|nr:tripartite tricarboxylate transporter TctB family protein [Geminicoccaceae bacterium]
MRPAFTAAILCLAVAYTYVAFAGLSFLSSTGRLGPGFFPRIVGLALIGACLYGIWGDLRERRSDGGVSEFWRITLAVAALSGLFVLLLNVLGGPLAMVAYMLATLSLLNRGRVVQNVLVSVLLPAALYLLFDVWLNAAMPPGIVVGFPG